MEESEGEEEETIVTRVTSGQGMPNCAAGSTLGSKQNDSGSSLVRTSEVIGSTLAELRKQVDLSVVTPVHSTDSRGCIETEMDGADSYTEKKGSNKKNKKSPAVLDYYKKKSKNKGFIKPSD